MCYETPRRSSSVIERTPRAQKVEPPKTKKPAKKSARSLKPVEAE